MVVAEYHTADVVRLSGLDKRRILEGLSDIGAPSEEMGEKLIVELTPNRLDFLSLEGVVRALRSFYGKRKPGGYRARPSSYELIIDKSVNTIRPYTAWAVAKGLDFGGRNMNYLIQFQEKLDATIGRKVKKCGIGFYPLDKLVFPLHYTTMKPEEIVYQPLNYPHKADAKEILEKHPKGMEYGSIIEKHSRYPVFLDAKGNILCLVPICNAKGYGEVTPQTRDVAIEVTGTDLNTVMAILDIICCSMADGGATIYQVKMRYPGKRIVAPALTTRKMQLDHAWIARLLGLKLPPSKIKQLLGRMDIVLTANNAMAPPYRVDVMHPVDILEDIAIAHGYNNFHPTLPDFFSMGRMNERWPRLHGVMRQMGFAEIETPILMSAQVLEAYGPEKQVKILNPVSEEYTTLRPALVPSLIATYMHNRVKALPQRLYEIGPVVDGGVQKQCLVFGWMDRALAFSDIRGVLQTLAKEEQWKFELKKEGLPLWLDPAEGGVIMMDNKWCGVIGKMKPDFLARYHLGFPIYICEIDIE